MGIIWKKIVNFVVLKIVIGAAMISCTKSESITGYKIYHIPHRLFMYAPIKEKDLLDNPSYEFISTSEKLGHLLERNILFKAREKLPEIIDYRTIIVNIDNDFTYHIGFTEDVNCGVAMILNHKYANCDIESYEAIIIQIEEEIAAKE